MNADEIRSTFHDLYRMADDSSRPVFNAHIRVLAEIAAQLAELNVTLSHISRCVAVDGYLDVAVKP